MNITFALMGYHFAGRLINNTNLGASLRARRYHSQSREICARRLTHNMAILLQMCVFYTEQDRP